MTQDTPEPVRRMVETFRQTFGDSAPEIAFRTFKDCDAAEQWLTTAATTLVNDAYSRGKEDGKLEEIEANAVSDITIAKDKVEQIRNDAVREERERVDKLLVTDFPKAWKVLVTKKDNHHEKCSWRVAGMLCDCAGQDAFIATIDYLKKALTPPTDNPTNV